MDSFFSESKIKINTSLIKSVPLPLAYLDKDLTFVSYSDEWLSNHNLDSKTINGSYFFDVLPFIPLDFKSILEHCLRENSSKNDEKRFSSNTGETIWLKWKINPWKNRDQLTVGLVLILENITHQKELDALINDAQHVSKTGGWEVDVVTGKAIWTAMVNSIHEMPIDYTPQSFEENFSSFKEGAHRNKVMAAAEKAMHYGVPWDEEALLITGTGKEIWVRSKGRVEFKGGKCIRLYGICQDIDDRKRAELSYRDSVTLLTNAVKASKVGTWEYNMDNGITVWDDVCYDLHYIDPRNTGKSVYTHWKNRLHPDDLERVKAEANLFYNERGKGVVEYRILLPNGNIRYLKCSITFVSEAKSGARKAIGICQDITKEKNAEIKLKEFARITGEQNNSLTNFAHMVSHDLRAHSTNLSVLTSLLIDEKDKDEKKQILKMLKKATYSLNSTVCNLNEVVQSTDTNIAHKLVPVNILDTIRKVQNNISTLFQEKEGFCAINVNKQHLVKVVPAYLDSILLNLFTNSLKYCCPDRTPIIKINTIKDKDALLLNFSDNGKGIDLGKYGSTIFGMNKTFHRNKDARGVGLYIIKNQIEAMGGSISITSEVNVGTTFTLKFKL